jgi:ATP-dependent DNA helicase RecG
VQAENQKGGDNIDSGGAIGGAIGGVIGGAIEDLTDRQKEVLAIIKQDNKISYRAIADKLKINESAVSKHIELLKEKGHIERVGDTRGYWKVTTSKLD